MGRVLIEAMASKKPILASSVGGVPHIIHDGINGLLFRNESVDELADKMKRILSNQTLSSTLAANGYVYSQTRLSEKLYAEQFQRMIYYTVDK